MPDKNNKNTDPPPSRRGNALNVAAIKEAAVDGEVPDAEVAETAAAALVAAASDVGTEPTAVPSRLGKPPGLPARIFSFIAGVVSPIICFGAACAGMDVTLNQIWQSGTLESYIGVLFAWPTIAVFWPLVLLSMVALTCFVWNPTASHGRFVRFGVAVGVVLSGQYLLLIMLTSVFVTFFAAGIAIVPFTIAVYVLNSITVRARRFTLGNLMAATAVCAVASLAIRLMGGVGALIQFGAGVGFWLIAATPTLTFIVFVRAAFFLAKGSDLKSMLGSPSMLIAWLIAWGTAWKVTVDLMMIEYAKLPTTNPNCYVCSAAAEGHAWLVGSKPIVEADSSRGVVNRQMKQLKFLEFALAAAFPFGHRWLRWCYNRVGPSLANACRVHRFVADLTFVVLSPLALLAEAVRYASGFERSRIDQIYRARPKWQARR